MCIVFLQFILTNWAIIINFKDTKHQLPEGKYHIGGGETNEGEEEQTLDSKQYFSYWFFSLILPRSSLPTTGDIFMFIFG